MFVVLVAHAAIVTIDNALADVTIVKWFFRRSFSAISSIYQNKSETLIIDIEIKSILNLTSITLPKIMAF